MIFLQPNIHQNIYTYPNYSWVGGAVEHGETGGSDKLLNVRE